ncbi:hypothetical protein [Hymenobacter edaphi]|uniref:Uncharacterized protein n=1 Tax=Hymenobacter edaphi TaxID=2211146 RepID=A0A328BCM5_9BACT|nr:hypothetical protein [Hymenobacter edaphi]RAK63554.1 hypothetical protein DLM85_21375 [Hymenobacter edaphi]
MLTADALLKQHPPAGLVQDALHEGRTVDAADLLAQWVQAQAAPELTDEQQAHLLHGCYDTLLRERAVHSGLWHQAQRCLTAALRR